MFDLRSRCRPLPRNAASGRKTLGEPRSTGPRRRRLRHLGLLLSVWAAPASAQFAFLSTAAPRPEGAVKVQHKITTPFDGEPGESSAFDHATSVEYGLANAFSLVGQVRLQTPDPAGLFVPNSLPGLARQAPDFAGLDLEGKYRLLDPAERAVGLSARWGAQYTPGRGQRDLALESGMAFWRHFLEGRLTGQTEVSIRAVHTTRSEIADGEAPGSPLRAETGAELEIGAGLAFRIANRFYLTGEAAYREDFETGAGGDGSPFRAGPGFAYRGPAFGIAVGFRRQWEGGGPEIEQDLRVKISFKF